MRDTLDTARSSGIEAAAVAVEADPLEADSLWKPRASNAEEFLEMIREWRRITGVMNEMTRAMGLSDFYPFVIMPAVLPKLHFIHCAITRGHAPASGATERPEVTR